MSLVIDMPIERFEERYSAQWQDWFAREYRRHDLDWVRLDPRPLTNKIETGAWLDVYGTNHYKAGQLRLAMEMLRDKRVGDGDIFFFHDLWFPGIEMLAYARSMSGIKFKIAGCLHAGTWDENDLLVRSGARQWASWFESLLFEVADMAFVATEYHADLIRSVGCAPMQVHVTGFPIYPTRATTPQKREHGLVVFPHRLDPEKDPESFAILASNEELQKLGYRFVRSRDVCKTKDEYYALLQRAEIAVSFAKQETWGIAMQEALFAGAIPFVPARLSYEEMYEEALQFGSMTELVSMLTNMAAVYDGAPYIHAAVFTKQRLEDAGQVAIHEMFQLMGVL